MKKFKLCWRNFTYSVKTSTGVAKSSTFPQVIKQRAPVVVVSDKIKLNVWLKSVPKANNKRMTNLAENWTFRASMFSLPLSCNYRLFEYFHRKYTRGILPRHVWWSQPNLDNQDTAHKCLPDHAFFEPASPFRMPLCQLPAADQSRTRWESWRLCAGCMIF